MSLHSSYLGLWRGWGSAEGERPSAGQNETCCVQICLLMRRWVICSEPDLLVVKWNNVNQYFSMTNYNFCHLAQCSWGKIASLRSVKCNVGTAKALFSFLSPLVVKEDWNLKRDDKVYLSTWLPLNSMRRKCSYSLILPFSWSCGVSNWLVWEQNLNKMRSQQYYCRCNWLMVFFLSSKWQVAGQRSTVRGETIKKRGMEEV